MIDGAKPSIEAHFGLDDFRTGATTFDLTGLQHNRADRAGLMQLAALAWMLHSPGPLRTAYRVVLPPRGSAALAHVARSGLLSVAAQLHFLEYEDGSSFDPSQLAVAGHGRQTRLPAVDWEVFDDLDSGDRLRVIPDLTDPRRARPGSLDGPYRFPWITRLGVWSAAISADGYRRLLGDTDLVLHELIDNVHRWSQARSAFAAVSVTRGGGRTDHHQASWNRLHLVVADNGRGVPSALRSDLAALAAVRRTAGKRQPASDDGDLVERLLLTSFGDRKLDNHHGSGLCVSQVRASQWAGVAEVLTSTGNGDLVHVRSRGLGQEKCDITWLTPSSDFAQRGTLVHVSLNAMDNSHAMATLQPQLAGQP